MLRQTSFQVTEAMQNQLADLRDAGFGTTTDIIRLAIDRMHREEISMKYRGFTITITEQLGGYGYLADDASGTVIEEPLSGGKAFATEKDATTAAKRSISMFLNSYHYEGGADRIA